MSDPTSQPQPSESNPPVEPSAPVPPGEPTPPSAPEPPTPPAAPTTPEPTAVYETTPTAATTPLPPVTPPAAASADPTPAYVPPAGTVPPAGGYGGPPAGSTPPKKRVIWPFIVGGVIVLLVLLGVGGAIAVSALLNNNSGGGGTEQTGGDDEADEEQDAEDAQAAVEDLADALDDGDAGAYEEVTTEDFREAFAETYGSDGYDADEFEEAFADSDGWSFEVDDVKVDGDEATVTTVEGVEGEEGDVEYELIKDDDTWLVDSTNLERVSSDAADLADAEFVVLELDRAYQEVDCDLYKETTTEDYLNGSSEGGVFDCASWEIDAENLTIDGEYVYSVDIVESYKTDDDTIEVIADEQFDDNEPTEATYILIRDGDTWLVDGFRSN